MGVSQVAKGRGPQEFQPCTWSPDSLDPRITGDLERERENLRENNYLDQAIHIFMDMYIYLI